MIRCINLRAVVLGLFLAWLLSLIAGVCVSSFVTLAAIVCEPGQPLDMDAINLTMHSNSVAFILSILGGLTSIIPGFVAGNIARVKPVANAFVVGLLSVATSCALLPFLNNYPFWYFPFCSLLIIMFSTCGGLLSYRRKLKLHEVQKYDL